MKLYNGEIDLSFDRRKHRYIIQENGNRFEVPSVTTILSIIDKSDALTYWAANQAVEYMRCNLLADRQYGRLELDSLLEGARFNFRSVSTKAKNIGSSFHDWIEEFLADDSIPLPELTNGLEVYNACRAAREWISSIKFTMISTEEVVYSRQFKYVGRIDFHSMINGELSVVDWKTSAKEYPEFRIQLAAYAQAYSESHNVQTPARWVILLDKETGEYLAKRFKSETQTQDFAAFLAAKELYLRMQELKKPRP